jgi:hypothetical protein
MENTIKRAMLRELMDLVDISNRSTPGLIRIVEKLHEAVNARSHHEPERYAPVDRNWKGRDPDVAQLTRSDLWSIVDTELEVRRFIRFCYVFTHSHSPNASRTTASEVGFGCCPRKMARTTACLLWVQETH